MTINAPQAAARIREALEAGPTPGPWLYRGKSNSFHKAPPEGTQYTYGDFILTVGSDDDEKPETQANIDYIAACAPEALIAILDRMDELAKDAARWKAEANDLRHLLDTRPALNEGLVEAYRGWTGRVYTADAYRAIFARAALTPKD